MVFLYKYFSFLSYKSKKRSNKKKCLVEILAAEGTEKQEENIRGLYNQVLVAGLLKNLEIGSGDICFVQH
jgi:hypothetical protein